MKFEVKLTAQDFFSFSVWHHHRRTFQGKALLFSSYFLIVVFVFTLFLNTRVYPVPFPQSLWILLLPAFWLCLLPGIAFLQFFNVRRSNPDLFNMRYDISKEGIEFESLNFNGREDWKIYQLVVETPKHYFLYISTQQARILPKREMEDAQIQKFRAYVLENLPNDKIHRSFRQIGSGNA